MNDGFNFEARLRSLGVIETDPFITAAGFAANRKVNLEEVQKKDRQLAAEMAGILAIRLQLYKPDVIVPVPTGANQWGKEIALHMKANYAKLRWQDKTAGRLRFATKQDKQYITEAERVALVDDAFTTGGSINKVAAFPGIAGKVVAAGVLWNRSEGNPKLNFPVETLIDSFIPLIEDE